MKMSRYYVGAVLIKIQLSAISFPPFFLRSDSYQERFLLNTQPPIACSKLTIETLEQGVKYAQS